MARTKAEQQQPRRWEILISDRVTGKFVVGRTKYTAGRYVTDDERTASYFRSMNPKLFKVLDLVEEPTGELGPIEPARPSTEGPLTVDDLRTPRRVVKQECRGCGVDFADLERHYSSRPECRPKEELTTEQPEPEGDDETAVTETAVDDNDGGEEGKHGD